MRPLALRATSPAARPRARESAQRGRPDLRWPSTRCPRRAPFAGSRMRESCVSPPCVGGRAGGALAKNPRRQPAASAASRVGRSPAPTTVCSRVTGGLSTGVAESPAGRAGSWQSHASMRPPSSPWLVLPVQLFGRPPRLYPGHQAAVRSPRLQRSLRLPSPPRLLAKG